MTANNIFSNTSYGSWLISTTNSLCVNNGNLVLQTVSVSYISNQQQMGVTGIVHACRTYVCRNTATSSCTVGVKIVWCKRKLMASLDIKFCNELYTCRVICAQGSNGMILMGTNGKVNLGIFL